MKTITDYHRPATLDEALALLEREDVSSIVVAGGTMTNAADMVSDTEIVDVQAVCSGSIDEVDGRVIVGSMTRLQDLIDHDAVPHLLRQLAQREGANTLRNAATVGGTVASGHPESELLAGLLVHEARVEVARSDGRSTVDVADLLADRSLVAGGIITSISVAVGGTTASARTGRTPVDTSIVAAIGRRIAGSPLLALTGVAATPVLVEPDDLESLDPPGDFRGSPDYRRSLAVTLGRRVIEDLGGEA